MAELVQQNAQEEQKNEDNALEGCSASPLCIVRYSNPDEKEKKGEVNTDDCALHRANRNGPAHILSFQGAPDVGTSDVRDRFSSIVATRSPPDRLRPARCKSLVEHWLG
jgi:hypothetical protein